MGRDAAGVRGVRLSADQRLIALIALGDGLHSDRLGNRLRQTHAA